MENSRETKISVRLALECVCFLHLKISVSGGLDTHFKERDEDMEELWLRPLASHPLLPSSFCSQLFPEPTQGQKMSAFL
jgi:hypothetical protein